MRIYKDLNYFQNNDKTLKLDLYLPDHFLTNMPTLIWIHGGGWVEGSKNTLKHFSKALRPATQSGFAVAVVDYTLAPQALFPTQVYELKAALRYLKSKATLYSLDINSFGVWGDSAGAHLASLLATNDPSLDGTLNSELKCDTNVQAACLYFPPIDLLELDRRLQKSKLSSEQLLKSTHWPHHLFIGPSFLETASVANPTQYLNSNTAPFFLLHGNQDLVVEIQQSQNFANTLRAAQIPVQFWTIDDAIHADSIFYSEEVLSAVLTFFKRTLV